MQLTNSATIVDFFPEAFIAEGHPTKGMIVTIKRFVKRVTFRANGMKSYSVVTMTEVTDEQVITIYNNYIEEEDFESKSDGHQTRLTEDMGYVSSVEETRKKLEELYNRNAKDSKES